MCRRCDRPPPPRRRPAAAPPPHAAKCTVCRDLGGPMAEADWPGGISAITVLVEDLDACRTFYAEVFGVDPIFSDDQSSAYRFGATIVNLLDVRAADELVAPARPGDLGGPRYVLTIGVGDVDATCAEL